MKILIEIVEDDIGWVNWAILEDDEDSDPGDVLESGCDQFDEFLELLKEFKDSIK